MATFHVKRSFLSGSLCIPPSKSQTLRAILFGALARGKSIIHNYLESPDTHAMIQACRHFGASIDLFADRIEILGTAGQIVKTEDVIQAGNSGLVLRFCTAIGALATHPVVVTGDYSIRHCRPMQPLITALNELGVEALSMRNDGFAPIIVRGPLTKGVTTLCGKDSQPVSALLIAAAFAKHPIEINVTDPGEKPWIDLTLSWFKRLGIPFQQESYERYRLQGSCRYPGFEYVVPGDLSTAAFPLVAALITGSEIVLHQIDFSDLQGDKEFITTLQKIGAQLEIDHQKKTLKVLKSPLLKGMRVDINNFIDSINLLAVLACYIEGETHIYNASIARHKECDRISCIAQELRKMGGCVVETAEGLIITPTALKGTSVSSHHDHRMAMALTIAGMAAEDSTSVANVECVAKTFPDFLLQFQQLGAQIKAC